MVCRFRFCLLNGVEQYCRVQEYDEVDEAVKEYKEKYRSSDYCREPIMKGYLSKATFHPGWALKEILSGKLCHLIHFDPEDESGASPDQAEYCYAIDFDTHKFYMQSRNRLELENVPLENISREKAKYKRAEDRRIREKVKFETAKKRMEMLNQLCVFDNGKTARTKRLLKQGPE